MKNRARGEVDDGCSTWSPAATWGRDSATLPLYLAHTGCRQVSHGRARRVEARRTRQRGGDEIDGETALRLPATFEIRPRASRPRALLGKKLASRKGLSLPVAIRVSTLLIVT